MITYLVTLFSSLISRRCSAFEDLHRHAGLHILYLLTIGLSEARAIFSLSLANVLRSGFIIRYTPLFCRIDRSHLV